MNLLVVRHGQTDWNLEERLQGSKDVELNQTGVQQAKFLKEALKDNPINLIICSPMLRTKKTAEIINDGRNIPIIFDERIMERSGGEFEGSIINDFDWKKFISYSQNNKYEKAESMHDFFNRIYSFMDDTCTKYSNQNVLLVTHGAVSLSINCYFNSIPEDEKLSSLILNNCEVAKYSI